MDVKGMYRTSHLRADVGVHVRPQRHGSSDVLHAPGLPHLAAAQTTALFSSYCLRTYLQALKGCCLASSPYQLERRLTHQKPFNLSLPASTPW